MHSKLWKIIRAPWETSDLIFLMFWMWYSLERTSNSSLLPSKKTVSLRSLKLGCDCKGDNVNVYGRSEKGFPQNVERFKKQNIIF